MKYDLTDEQHNEAMSNVSHLFSFPTGALDKQIGELLPEKRLAIKNKLEAIGFDFDQMTLQNTIRDILKYIIHSIQLASWGQVAITNKNFGMSTTIADIPDNAKDRISQHMQNLGIDISWITASNKVNDIVQKIMFHSDSSPRLFGDGRQWFYHDEDIE